MRGPLGYVGAAVIVGTIVATAVPFVFPLGAAEGWAFPEARVDATKPARVQAVRTGNDVELGATNVAEVAVYLSTSAFDPGKNVRVRAGGATLADGALVPDRRLLLTEARARSERGVTYAAKWVVTP